MDLQKEIAELRRQLEEKNRADDLEKSRLRLALEEAKAEIKADEAYFDRLVEENEKLKADNRRLENGTGAYHGHSSSHESPALSGSPVSFVGPPDTAALSERPNTTSKHTTAITFAECAPEDGATGAGDDPVSGAAPGPGNAGATLNKRARGASPLAAHASRRQGSPPGTAAAHPQRNVEKIVGAAVQMLALPAPASAPGRHAPEMMHLDEVRHLGADLGMAHLAGTLNMVLDALEPLRGLLPVLSRLPAALSALEQLPKIQDMASRATQLSTQNKEELRTVSRMVAVGSDIIDQSRKTVSQLQERVAKEEAEAQARAAASNRATQRVEASVVTLRREQKQSAQSVLTMQNTLSDLQSAQLPSRLSDMEAEIAALKAKIAAQAQQQQQQVPAAGRHVPAPAPPMAPFPGVAIAARPLAPAGPRPPTAPHPADAAALAATPAPAAAPAPQPTSAPAGQPARLMSAWPPPLQHSVAAAPTFSMVPSQLSIPSQLLMPTGSSAQLAPPHSSVAAPLLSKQAVSTSIEKQPSAAAAPSTEDAQPSGAAQEPAAKLKEAASAGSKPAMAATTWQPDPAARRFAANSSGTSLGAQANATLQSSLAESSGRPSTLSAPPLTINLSNLDDTGQGRRARQEALELFMHMDPIFVCGVCEVAFASEEGFLWHLNSKKHGDAVSLHASNSSLSEETKVFRQHFAWHCELCNREFLSCHAFSSHSTQSKPHASALADRMKKLGLKQDKARNVERHVPLLEGKALRDAWLNKHRGIQASGAAQQPLGDSSVRRISIAAGFPSLATPADQAADPPPPSPTAATAAAVAMLPDLAREQSVEEGELVPGQPVPALPASAAGVGAPRPGAETAQGIPDVSTRAAMVSSAEQASRAAGQASTAMQVTADAAQGAPQSAAAGEAERAVEQQQTQEAAALLQQQARQAYALQRQLKEQKKQEQLQRLNKSLGFAFALPAASQSTPALASLPPLQALFPAPLDAAAAAALPQNHHPPVQRTHVAAAVGPIPTPAPTGTSDLPPPIMAPAQPISAAPAASAAQPACSGVSSAAFLPASTLPQPLADVAALSGVPVRPPVGAPAQASETAPRGQHAATPRSTSRVAASSAGGPGATSISKTAEAFLDSLLWSQPQSPLPGRAPSLVGAAPAEAPAMSGVPILVTAKEQAGAKSQDVVIPAAVSEDVVSRAQASKQAPGSGVQGGEQKQTQDLALPEALTLAPVMSAPAAAVVEQVLSAQAAPPVPVAQRPKVADAPQSMDLGTPSAEEGPLKPRPADKAPESLSAGASVVAASHAQAPPLAHCGPPDMRPEAKEADVAAVEPVAATPAETRSLPEGAAVMQADAPASASAMPAGAEPDAAVLQLTAIIDPGHVGTSSAAHEGSSRDISISFGGSSSHMSAEQMSEAVPALQHASIAAGAQPRAASQQPHSTAGESAPDAGPVAQLRATQQGQLEGPPSRSSPQQVLLKGLPAASQPATAGPSVTARDEQRAEAQPSSKVQGGTGSPDTPSAAAAAASVQAPSSNARKESECPADRIDAAEAAALHNASRSPQTPLYFRLTDMALGGDIPSQGELPGDATYCGLTGSWAVRAPLSTTATVLRGTSAGARSGSIPASTKTGSAWTVLPTQPRGAPGASPAGKQPPKRPQPQKESPAKPAHVGPLANRKRPAEGIRGAERPVKRVVIRTGCRPPVQPASPVVTAANTATVPITPVSATTSSSGPNPSAASLVSHSVDTAPRRATAASPHKAVPEAAKSGASSMAVGAPVVAGKQAAEGAPDTSKLALADQKAAPTAAAAASASRKGTESGRSASSSAKAAPQEALVDVQKAAQSPAVDLGKGSSKVDKEAREVRPKESAGRGSPARTPAADRPSARAAAAAATRPSGPPSHSTSGSKPDAPSRAGPERKRSSTPTRSTSKQSTQHSRGQSDRGRQTAEQHRGRAPARDSDRREPSKQPAGSSRGASLSRRPEPGSGRRSADPPRHAPSASRVSPSARRGRSADRSNHRSEVRSRGVELHNSHRSSVRDVSTGHRIRERDRAFGPPASPTSPAGTPRGNGSPAAAGSKRPREEAGRDERRQHPPAKKPAAPAEKPAPAPAGKPTEPVKEPAPPQKPAAASTDKPPATVSKPAVAAEKLSPAAGKKPANAAERPAAVPAQGPAVRTDKPPAVTGKPGEAAQKPTIVPAKRPATAAANPPPAPAKKLAQAAGKPAPVPVPVPRPAAAAQKPAPVPPNKPAAAAKNPVPPPVKKPAAPQTATHARIPAPSAKPAGANAPGKLSSGAAAQQPSRQIPAPVRGPNASASGTTQSQSQAPARQQQPQQQKLSPHGQDRRVQLEAGIAEVRSKLKQMEQKHKSAQGRNSARSSAQAPPQQQSHGGRVITISSTSQPGPQVTVGGHPRLEGPPRGASNFHHQHPARSQSPHQFHSSAPPPRYSGGSGGPMLPPEQQHYQEDRYGERPPQMHPPGLHMPMPVPSLSLPPYPPPFLPPLYADQPLPFPGGHPDQQPDMPMFESSRAPANYEHYPPPHQQPEQEPLPPWHTDMFGPPDGFPFRPY